MAEKKKKKATTDEEKEHKKNWREVYASVGDIKAFLGGRLYLRHNVITGRVECRLPSNYETDGTDWQPISDRVVNSLWAELSQVKPVRAQDMYRVMESDFVEEYHPFRYYLDHLPPWDGQDYIIELSVSITIRGGVEKQMLFYEYLKKWLVAMVAGWVDESVVNNVILVLIGEQGSYKTTWFNYLLPPELKTYFYTKTNANRMGRDDLLTLAQYGLVCCEELDTMRPSELNQLKAFLGDETGNRRWLPFEVESIRSPRDHPFNYAGIYAQAYALYQEGFRYWFSQDEIRQLSEHNRAFETPRLETELVQLYFRQPTEVETGEFMSVARAMQIVSSNISQKLSAVHLGRALSELGFRRVKYQGVRGYIVVCRKPDEMQMVQRKMAREASPDEWTEDSSGQCF